MTFGERLKILRQEKEITQSQLGELLGVSARMVSFYEKDKHIPRDSETLIKIAEYFNVSLDYLFGITKVRNYNHLSSMHRLYESLSDTGKQTANDFILFLSKRYKQK